jgi:hypothetical protein
MMFNVALIFLFAIIVFAALMLSLGVILLYMKRQTNQQRPAGKTGDELTEAEAADITATWNTLNPP